MENVKISQYLSPKLEIITFDCNDILTSSGGDGNGYNSDNNEVNDW